MRPLRSTFFRLALAALCLAGGERIAGAQACCVAPSAWGLARLGPAESWLVGGQARAQAGFGSFDANGTFHGVPAGARDLASEQDVFAAARVLGRGELALNVPFFETARTAGPSRRAEAALATSASPDGGRSSFPGSTRG